MFCRPRARLRNPIANRRLFLEPLEGRSLLATIVVTGTGDTIAVDGVVTLREAITSANDNANVNADVAADGTYGSDTISFNIAGAGIQTIKPVAALPTITDPVVIDGYTQPGTAPNTDPNGFNATLLVQLAGIDSFAIDGLVIIGRFSTVRGLIINRFGHGIVLGGTGGHTVEGNLIGTDANGSASLANDLSGVEVVSADNRIGGVTPAARNVISGNRRNGIRLAGPSLTGNPIAGNIIAGNFIGTTSTGREALGNGHSGISINSASRNVIGGLQPGARNIVSANGAAVNGNGISIFYNSDSNVVQGNYIGLDVTGTQALGNAQAGVGIYDGNHNLIGGTTSEARNVISANGSSGVALASSSNNSIQGNYIGTDVSGALPLGNVLDGVGLYSRDFNNVIGGTGSGAANRIAFNGGSGVHLRGEGESGWGNAILTNVIFTNAGLGIDLDLVGVTANDAGDADAGPNNLQNFPELISAKSGIDSTKIHGTLSSHTNTRYRIEFYASTEADAAGFGEGQTYLGYTVVTTGAFGSVEFSFAAPTPTLTGQFIAATATRLDNNLFPIETSEFSAVRAVEIQAPECEVTTLNLPSDPGTAVRRDDADHPGTAALIVTGTSGNDVILVEPRPTNSAQIRVTRNGQQLGVFSRSAVLHIVVFGLAGDDTITVSALLSQPATLFGEYGNDQLFGAQGADRLSGGFGKDQLYGGSGNDVMCGGYGSDLIYGQAGNDLLGGDESSDQLFGDAGRDLLLGGAGSDSLRGGIGNDRLFGQAGYDWLYGDAGHDIAVGGGGIDQVRGGGGRDVLIGGRGVDTLFGEADDDILVAGFTVHDNDEAGLRAILAEWTFTSSYNTRVNRLRSGGGANGVHLLNGTTVSDDAAIDTLWGDAGLEWFLLGPGDKLQDRIASERLN